MRGLLAVGKVLDLCLSRSAGWIIWGLIVALLTPVMLMVGFLVSLVLCVVSLPLLVVWTVLITLGALAHLVVICALSLARCVVAVISAARYTDLRGSRGFTHVIEEQSARSRRWSREFFRVSDEITTFVGVGLCERLSLIVVATWSPVQWAAHRVRDPLLTRSAEIQRALLPPAAQ